MYQVDQIYPSGEKSSEVFAPRDWFHIRQGINSERFPYQNGDIWVEFDQDGIGVRIPPFQDQLVTRTVQLEHEGTPCTQLFDDIRIRLLNPDIGINIRYHADWNGDLLDKEIKIGVVGEQALSG